MRAWIWYQPVPCGIERTAMEFFSKADVCLCGVIGLTQRMTLLNGARQQRVDGRDGKHGIGCRGETFSILSRAPVGEQPSRPLEWRENNRTHFPFLKGSPCKRLIRC